MRSLKINRLLPIYISIVPLKFGVDIQSQTKVRVRKPKNPIWPQGSQNIQFGCQAAILKVTSLKINRLLPIYIYISIVPLNFGVDIQSRTKVRVRKQKIQYGRLAAMLKLTFLKINRLLHIYLSIVPVKFGVDIQGQTKVRVKKPKNLIWPPGGHFESDVPEDQ